MKTTSSTTPKIVGTIVLTAVMLIGIYVFLVKTELSQVETTTVQNTPTQTIGEVKAQSPTPLAQATQPESTKPAAEPTVTSAKPTTTYKNGTYTKSTSYQVPGETNTLNTTITVENDLITSVSSTHEYASRESRKYINGFDAGVSGVIVGTKLGGVKPSRVGGASLTTAAFNNALNSFVSEAAY